MAQPPRPRSPAGTSSAATGAHETAKMAQQPNQRCLQSRALVDEIRIRSNSRSNGIGTKVKANFFNAMLDKAVSWYNQHKINYVINDINALKDRFLSDFAQTANPDAQPSLK